MSFCTVVIKDVSWISPSYRSRMGLVSRRFTSHTAVQTPLPVRYTLCSFRAHLTGRGACVRCRWERSRQDADDEVGRVSFSADSAGDLAAEMDTSNSHLEELERNPLSKLNKGEQQLMWMHRHEPRFRRSPRMLSKMLMAGAPSHHHTQFSAKTRVCRMLYSAAEMHRRY
jgi:hypothetical protein